MDSQSAWRVYKKTFGLNRATNYRKHTYIYAEILSQYLDEHVIVRQYREELLIASDWPVTVLTSSSWSTSVAHVIDTESDVDMTTGYHASSSEFRGIRPNPTYTKGQI